MGNGGGGTWGMGIEGWMVGDARGEDWATTSLPYVGPKTKLGLELFLDS